MHTNQGVAIKLNFMISLLYSAINNKNPKIFALHIFFSEMLSSYFSA